MKEEILLHLDNPVQLERLYRADKSTFKRAFNDLYPQIRDNNLTDFWNARLNVVRDEISWGARNDLIFVIVASLIAGTISKLPAILSLNEEFFYTRNIGFILFPALSAYFAWKNKLSASKIAFIAATMLIGLVFINSLPDNPKSDTLLLSCIHLVLFLWSMLGLAFIGEFGNNVEKRLGYLRFNGDLIVMTTLIMIGGVILTGVTIGLFNLIGFKIEKFYFDNIVVFCLPAVPILATYLTRTNPQLVGKVSPVIAKIFSPLVLVMLTIYLVAIVYSGKDPYNDRDFLMMFNALLIGVMAIIFFSIAGTSKSEKKVAEVMVLLLLSVLTILVNGVALSAIVFRISEWGITPNRIAVLGGNILILVNLLIVTAQLFRVISRKAEISEVGRSISFYLPVYWFWTIFVTFIFPFIFGFK